VTIRILIVDDQPLLRTGFRLILEEEADLEVVAEAGDGEEAIERAAEARPDVVLMDIRMPRLDGVEATRRLVQATAPTDAPTLHVLVLTTFDLDEYVVEALRAGASGFLLKDAPAEDLIAAIRAVAAGDAVVAPSVTRRLLDRFAQTIVEPPQPSPVLGTLTDRELAVLRLMARAMSNGEIAAELGVSETTVKTHVGHVLGKLGLRDRVQAVVLAYESGLVRAGHP
jgi:DNA-binding NarL/FixJ family response regulator